MNAIFVLTLMWSYSNSVSMTQQEFLTRAKCEVALQEARRVHDKQLNDRGYFGGFCAEK